MDSEGSTAKKPKQQEKREKYSRQGQKYEQKQQKDFFYKDEEDWGYLSSNRFPENNYHRSKQQQDDYLSSSNPKNRKQEPNFSFDAHRRPQESFPMIKFANIQDKLVEWINHDNDYDNKQLIDDFEESIKKYHKKNPNQRKNLKLQKQNGQYFSPAFRMAKLDLQKALGTLIMIFPDKPCLKIIVGVGFLISDNLGLFCCENYFQLQYYRGYSYKLLFQSHHTKESYKVTEELRMQDNWGYKNLCVLKLSQSMPFFSGCLLGKLQYSKNQQPLSYYRFSFEGDEQEYVYKQNISFRLIKNKQKLQNPFEKRDIDLIFSFRKNKFELLVAPVSDKKNKKNILNFAKQLIEYGVSPYAFCEQIKRQIVEPEFIKKLSHKLDSYTYRYYQEQEDKKKEKDNKEGKLQQMQQMHKKYPKNERLSGPIDFKIMNCYIRYIQVNSLRLYFQIYQKQPTQKIIYYQTVQTIEFLNTQYQKIKKKSLILQGQNIKIPLIIPLKLIVGTEKGIKTLEATLKMLNQKEYIPSLPFTRVQLQKQWSQYLARYNGYDQVQFFSASKDIIEVIIYKRQTLLIKRYVKVNNSTRISDIIEQLKLQNSFSYDFSYVFTEHKKKIDQRQYNMYIFDVVGINKRLQLYLISAKCMLSDNSIIKLTNNTSDNYFTLSLMDIKSSKTKYQQFMQNPTTLSFEEDLKMIIPQKIDIIGEAYPVFTYFSVNLEGKEQISIQCSLQTYFYCKDRWIAVNQLQIGTLLLGIPSKMDEYDMKGKNKYYTTQYAVKSIKRVVSKEPKNFYPISVSKSHNLIVNNLIMHNRNPLNITIMEITQDGEFKSSISVYRNEKIKERFKDLPVYLCGNLLQNQLSYGDYNIQPPFHLVVIKRKSANYQKISQLNFTCSTESAVLYKTEIEKTYDMLKQEYLCIHKNQITPLSIELINRLIYIDEQSILIQPKTLLKRMEFIKRVKKYSCYSNILFAKLQHIKNTYQFHQIMEETSDSELSTNDKLLIHTYTAQQIAFHETCESYYLSMNALLRIDESALIESDRNNLLFCMAGRLIQSVQLVEELQQYSTFYRGIPVALDIILKNKERSILVLESFTSTSTDLEQARIFKGSNGTLLQIKSLSGKSIQKYSRSKRQKQILLVPYSYFIIDQLPSQHQQFLRLTEIPLPYTNKNKIIFWVDDFPALNYITINKLPEQFEVVRVTTTAVIKIIIQKFLWIYKLLGKTIIIISDMVRQQNNLRNFKAGAQLFDIIFNQLGLSDKAFIYAGDIQKSTQSLKEKNVPSPSERIFIEGERLLKEIQKYRE